jgi:ATP-dependent Clp protease ATP-binding subunit ClpX
MSMLYTPQDIYKKINSRVVGQEKVKRALSVQFSSVLSARATGLDADGVRLLIYGPTGSGKTYSVQQLVGSLDGLYSLFINTASLTGAGWHGDGLDNVAVRLQKELTNRAETAVPKDSANIDYLVAKLLNSLILVFDEFDKIICHDQQATHKLHLQQELLKFIEDQIIEIPVHGKTYYLNMKSAHCVFIGAFQEWTEAHVARQIGFFSNSETKTPAKENIKQKLMKSGVIPELAGRITSMVAIDLLTNAEMVNIAKQHEHYLQEKFGVFGINIIIKGSFYQEVVDKAMNDKLGARAIKSVIDEVVQDVLFDCEKYAEETAIVFQGIKNDKLRFTIIKLKQLAVV